MSLVLEDTINVDATPDETFAFMSDVERVHPCIPGAELVGERADGSYDVRIAVRLGPLNMKYKGTVQIAERDPAGRRAELRAKATEERGQGNAQATMSMAVDEGEAGTSVVTLRADILVTGRVAQMGRGLMVDVSQRMVREMAECVEQTLVARRATPPAESAGGSPADVPETPRVQAKSPNVLVLLLNALRDRIRRWLGRAQGTSA